MSIFQKLLSILPSYTIPDDEGKPYLTRYYITPNREWWRKWFPGIYLHHVHQSDKDRELHSHPWSNSVSLILHEGYLEEKLVDGFWDEGSKTYYNGSVISRLMKPGSINVLTHNTFHRLELLNPEKGCWTLFMSGPRVNIPEKDNWGFISRDGTQWESHTKRAERMKQERLQREAAVSG